MVRAILGVCAAILSAYAGESTGARLAGLVADPSGAVIPDIAVQVKAADGRVSSVVTGRQGNYVLNLEPGAYQVLVEAPGFARFKRDGVVLGKGKTAELDIALEISGVSERVVVTAKAPPLESALETRTRNSQEVLEIREVRESSAKDVGEAIASIDGMSKIRKAGIANDVILRGFQQGNINVLIDGERVYGACPSHMDPGAFHVDFAEIAQVEVTKGPFDIRNEGSLGGTVDIVSKEPEQGLRVTPNFSTGSFGYYNPSLTASYAGDRFSALAGYSFRRSMPYVDGSGKRVTDYANYQNAFRDSTAFDVNTGWFKFGFAPAKNQRLQVDYTAQRGGQVLYPFLTMDAMYDNADRASASYLIDDLHGAVRQVRLQGYMTRVDHLMTDQDRTSAAGSPRGYNMSTLATTRAIGGRAEADYSGVVIGVEAFRRYWNTAGSMLMGKMYMASQSIPDVAMTVAGAYAQYRKTLFDRLQLSAAARLDGGLSAARSASVNTNLYWAYNSTRATSATDVNPSGNVWLTYALPKGLELFTGVGSSVRLPDPVELYFVSARMGTDWVGNPQLRPSRNTETDLGLSYRRSRFTLRPTVFYSRLGDYILIHDQVRVNMAAPVMNSAAKSYENVDARMYGGELSYSVGLSRALMLLGGLSYTRGTNEARPADHIFSRNLAEMPPLKTRAALRYGNRRFFGEVEGVGVAAQDRFNTDLGETRTPGYALLNVKAGVHTRKLNLAAGVANVLDRFYCENFSYQRDPFRAGGRMPEPGRNVFLNAAYVF